ncbi:MAG: adenylosuccinate lyase [Bacteroidia bacterium]
MLLNPLTAISPVDGRYRSKTDSLAPYFSEFGLIKYRVLVEVKYFIALTEIPLPQLKNFPKDAIAKLENIAKNFSEEDALKIKDIEKVTNHDVKAVEYFLREKWEENSLQDFTEFIHFGLTSQDINNTSIPLSIKDALLNVMLPELEKAYKHLQKNASDWAEIALLARTHGQAASPTRLGKEFQVFVSRLEKQIEQLKAAKHYGKFGGATGNYNAHKVAYPNTDWKKFGNDFLDKHLGLVRNEFTTQIDHYDDLSNLFDNLRRINVILIDLCRDIWTYISMDYFKQTVNKNEVGSSAMPHKVNPIDFENAEGNLGLANAIFDHLSNKLPISRLQRDLTDSTVLRNVGVPFAHTLIAYQSLMKGLGKLVVNENKIARDLEENWAVVAEAIQTVLRRENYPHPYEKLKQFSRGKGALKKEDFNEFIDSLDISQELKQELLAITPFNYTGI